MGKLTDEQARQLAELEAARDAPDDTGDDDIEWWEDPSGGRGGRMRAARARSHGPDWLRDMLKDRDETATGDDKGAGETKDPPAGTAGGTKRFSRRVS